MKVLFALIVAGGLFSALSATGCQTAHSESDKTGIMGGHTHEETTVTKNPITGDTSVEHTQQKTP